MSSEESKPRRVAERIGYKIKPLLTDKYTNSLKIAVGIIEQELRWENLSCGTASADISTNEDFRPTATTADDSRELLSSPQKIAIVNNASDLDAVLNQPSSQNAHVMAKRGYVHQPNCALRSDHMGDCSPTPSERVQREPPLATCKVCEMLGEYCDEHETGLEAEEPSAPLGMDFWWDKFCSDHAYDNEPEHTSVKQACEFAQWFAAQCAEAGEVQEVSAHYVQEIRPRPDDPSCHVCGAQMVPKEWKCLSCKATTGAQELSARSRAMRVQYHHRRSQCQLIPRQPYSRS
jgi:hypothetical protein